MPVQITNLSGTFWAGLNSGFSQFMNYIPSFLGALIILVAGWYVSKFVGRVIERLLVAAKLEVVAQKAKVSEYLPHSSKGGQMGLSYLVGSLAKWFIFLVFVQAAANTLGIIQVSSIINASILFIPNILVAGIFVVFGSWASRYFSASLARPTAGLVRYGIMGFAVIAAVSQLGVATNLINILFAGLVTSLALAFGLAFGLGGQSAARDITQNLMGKGPSFNEIPKAGESDSSDKNFSH